MRIVVLSDEEVKAWSQDAARALRRHADAGEMDTTQARFERGYLANFRTYSFWSATIHALETERGELLNVNATRFSAKKRETAWGRYITSWASYTMPQQRFRGYATALEEHVERTAAERGYSRLKTIVNTWGGFRLHWRLGHEFWGVNDKGELEIDTPVSAETFPEGIPIKVRKWSQGRLTPDDLYEVLVNPRGLYHVERRECARVLDRDRG